LPLVQLSIGGGADSDQREMGQSLRKVAKCFTCWTDLLCVLTLTRFRGVYEISLLRLSQTGAVSLSTGGSKR
jgi:hypothetical protein